MDLKQVISALFILAGGAAMVYGVILLFQGQVNSASLASSILGVIFFIAGIGILKSAKTSTD